MIVRRNLTFVAALTSLSCGQTEPPPMTVDCRTTRSCDPDAWTITVWGAAIRGGREIPGLLNWTRSPENQIPTTALGGQQTVRAKAEFVVARDEQPNFQLVFERGLEGVSATATSASFRATAEGQGRMFVEQNVLRGSVDFTYPIEVRPVDTVLAVHVAFLTRGPGEAAAVAQVPSWILAGLLDSTQAFLIDEDITVRLAATQQTLTPTPAWDMFVLPGLDAGVHELEIETGSGRVFRNTVEVVERLDKLLVYRGDGARDFDISRVEGTATMCVAGETNDEPISLAEASFTTNDVHLKLEPLVAEEGTLNAGYSSPWCRRVSRDVVGLGEFTVTAGGLTRTLEVSFE